RRDLLVLWSYRAGFFSDWIYVIAQVLVFYFINRLVPSSRLPTYGGRATTYIQFVTVALVLTTFMQITLGRLVSTLRNEQLMGTLESLLVTPTAPTTIQLGSVVYDVLYVPLRTAVFLTLMYFLLGVRFYLSGLLPVAAIFAVFIPFMWGLSVLS